MTNLSCPRGLAQPSGLVDKGRALPRALFKGWGIVIRKQKPARAIRLLHLVRLRISHSLRLSVLNQSPVLKIGFEKNQYFRF